MMFQAYLKLQLISDSTKKLLEHHKYHSKSYNLINIKSFFNLIINIVEKEEKLYKEDEIEYRDIVYSKFLDTSSIQKTILLGENSDDIPIYEIFVKYYQSKTIKDVAIMDFLPRRIEGKLITNRRQVIVTWFHSLLCLLFLMLKGHVMLYTIL